MKQEKSRWSSKFPYEASKESLNTLAASSRRLKTGVISPLFIFFRACYRPSNILLCKWQVTLTFWGFLQLFGTFLPPSPSIMALPPNLIFLSSGSFPVPGEESSILVLSSHNIQIVQRSVLLYKRQIQSLCFFLLQHFLFLLSIWLDNILKY